MRGNSAEQLVNVVSVHVLVRRCYLELLIFNSIGKGRRHLKYERVVLLNNVHITVMSVRNRAIVYLFLSE